MSTPSVAFVCCIEPGGLEEQTLRLVESIRKWGGRFNNSEIYAIQPRSGLKIQSSTQTKLKSFDVIYKKIKSHDLPWNGYANKPWALQHVSNITNQELIVWMDSDMLMLKEPGLLELPDAIDIAGMYGGPALESTGPDDIKDIFWNKCYKILGINPESVPYVQSAFGNQIRLYIHSGIFAFRNSSRFTEDYYKCFNEIIRSKIASQVSGIFFHEMVAVALTTLRMNLTHDALPISYNYSLNPKSKDRISLEEINTSVVLHYHGAMWPEHYPFMLDWIKQSDHDEIFDWLKKIGPLTANQPITKKFIGKLLKIYRNKKFQKYRKSCTIY